jgi:1,4-dihydroxy-2-naphthoyl-CoA hydrolase
MPVDHRTHQPMGILHGGASTALAETLGSVASHLIIDNSKCFCMGLEINANHVQSKKEGLVTGIAKPIHLGVKTHIWEIRIIDERQKLMCISRLTMAVFEQK